MRGLVMICCCLLGIQWAQAQNLKGKVLDQQTGKAMQGVGISVESGLATQSTGDGSFQLKLSAGSYLLKASYVGYATIHIPVNIPLKDSLMIRLVPSEQQLEGVTISTGYQTLPRERATGSFAVVDQRQFELQAGTDVLSRLESISNGLTVDRRSSSSGQLMVRGLSTIAGPKSPLIILDNFPYQGDVANLNPNDMESIVLLKDAAATSIWGSRAGNGVIVLTSKKAKRGGGMQVDFNANVLLAEKPDLFSVPQMGSSEFIEVEQFLYDKGFYASRINSAAKPALSPVVELLLANTKGSITAAQLQSSLEQLRQQDVREAYTNLVYQRPFTQQYNLSLRGSEQRIDWYLMIGNDRNRNEVDAASNRLNLISRNTLRLGSKLKVDFGINYTYQNGTGGKASFNDLKNSSGVLYPYLSLADDSGQPLAIPQTYALSYLQTLNRDQFYDWNYYPLSDYLNNNIGNNRRSILGNVALSYELMPGLNFKAYYQREYQQTGSKSIYGTDSYTVRSLVNTYTQLAADGKVTRIVPMAELLDWAQGTMDAQSLRAQLGYNKTLGRGQLDFLAGFELNERRAEGITGRVYGYSDERLSSVALNYNIAYPNYITKANSFLNTGQGLSSTLNRFVSVYANAAYTFDGKYILSASARRDASNLFGVSANDKWKPLWSVGAAWNVHREKFMQLAWLNELKLRGSYGLSGNVDPSRAALTTLLVAGTSTLTQGAQARFDQFANPSLRWEKVATANLGFDFALFNNALTGSVEVFQKVSSDLYGNTPVDYTAVPAASLVMNVAKIRAKGLDVALRYKLADGKFKWVPDLNFNLNKDEVLEYYQASDQGAIFVGTGITASPLKGYPVYSVFSYRWAGLNPLNGNPQGYYQGAVTDNYTQLLGTGTKVSDLVFNGPAFAPVYGSLGQHFAYQNLSLDVRFSFKLGHSFGRSGINYNNLFNSGTGHPEYAQRWQQPGDEAHTQVPSLVYPAVSRRDNFYNNSEVLIEDASSLRLAFVTLGYKWDAKWLSRLSLKSLSIQANASNLGMVWRANKQGLDPDYRTGAIPPARVFSLGLRCGL
ncbi:SusC/RagA family TonB-linked outer membrane protein [Pedobacter ureilyticus]|uniref:SusC/RagA family TonB-linked outer membrane protein n=1 Tax=Pedobacter ureilyticus TaxID=1393051 RepID=A0ABW9J6Y3_9SPHI|nr:SusC/RagA family TonB-linked outer membrane protein [Pedobacter helvus]